ncbi:MAG TPA: hypothetical protein VN661_10535 [Candidatus Acidoferrales bacterium]|nr:hypothetical protein [Candidatus Acidoferrales bacterium]
MQNPRAEYESRLAARNALSAAKERVHIRIGNAKLAAVIAGLIVVALWFGGHHLSGYWVLAPAGIYAVLAFAHERVLRVRNRANAAANFYARGIARMDDRWAGSGDTGERFRDAKHVYAEDLDLFGQGGLFDLLCAARLPMGQDRLAQWLLSPSPAAAILERQRTIAELRANLDLREELAVAGEELRPRFAAESLAGWAEGAPAMPRGAWPRIAAVALAACALATFVFLLAARDYRPLAATLFIEALVLSRWHRKASAVADALQSNAEGIELFARILARIERESFSSERLRALAATLRSGPVAASQAIAALARIAYWMDGRHGYLMKLLELPILYTVQTVLAADQWRRRHGASVRAWIESTGEMEALLSLAGYSFEHPGDPFPEIAPAGSGLLFAAEEMGHPLIPAAQCVRNSLRLDGASQLLLISGSNMSGKSTLLRTVGINAVLAMAGAPVRATSLRLSPLRLGTRIRSTDSLQEGRSNFYTEILRIRQVYDLARGPQPLLFLFDELLEGTNSKDRRTGAEGLLAAMLARGAMGIVSTHDLALTEITQSLGPRARNRHFQDYVEQGKMRFDYKLRDGVVARSNALELMRLIGLDV